MQTSDQFFLMLFALLGFGLLVMFSSLTKVESNKPLRNWWVLTVGLYAVGALLFSLIPWAHSTIKTPANTAVMGSMLFNALQFRSWRQPIKEPLFAAAWTVLAMLVIIYEILRQHAVFTVRVVFVSTTFIVCLIWQGYELMRLIQTKKAHILKFFFLRATEYITNVSSHRQYALQRF